MRRKGANGRVPRKKGAGKEGHPSSAPIISPSAPQVWKCVRGTNPVNPSSSSTRHSGAGGVNRPLPASVFELRQNRSAPPLAAPLPMTYLPGRQQQQAGCLLPQWPSNLSRKEGGQIVAAGVPPAIWSFKMSFLVLSAYRGPGKLRMNRCLVFGGGSSLWFGPWWGWRRMVRKQLSGWFGLTRGSRIEENAPS